jgi:hypothetical protein
VAGRIRSIKPETLDDEVAAALSDGAWRLWVSMWCLADDFGNCRAGDRYLAASVWQDTSRKVAATLRELADSGLVTVYTVNGQTYAHVCGWEKHQRMDNAGKPRVPGPEQADSTTCTPFRGESPRVAASVGDLPLDHRPPTTDHRPPNIAQAAPERVLVSVPAAPRFDLDALYAAYPRKEGKARGMAKLRAIVSTDADYSRHKQAIANLIARIARDAIEAQYVPHFSTWVAGKWLDYADGIPPSTRGTAQPQSSAPGPAPNPASRRSMSDVLREKGLA